MGNYAADMSDRIRRLFSVSSVANDHVWLKLLEGDKRGLEFGAYADPDILRELREGQRVEVEMESRNARNTKWVITDVAEPSDQPSEQALAD